MDISSSHREVEHRIAQSDHSKADKPPGSVLSALSYYYSGQFFWNPWFCVHFAHTKSSRSHFGIQPENSPPKAGRFWASKRRVRVRRARTLRFEAHTENCCTKL